MSCECNLTSWMSLPVAFRHVTETQDADIVYHCLPKALSRLLEHSSTPTIRSWWNQWIVMAAHHCYSLWWMWKQWSYTLWVTLMRLWLRSIAVLPCEDFSATSWIMGVSCTGRAGTNGVSITTTNTDVDTFRAPSRWFGEGYGRKTNWSR